MGVPRQRWPAATFASPERSATHSAEWSIIVERARLCGRVPARYVRETSLGAVPKARYGRDNDDLVHELGRIGTTLARLVAQDRGSQQQPAFEATLNELLTTVRRLG